MPSGLLCISSFAVVKSPCRARAEKKCRERAKKGTLLSGAHAIHLTKNSREKRNYSTKKKDPAAMYMALLFEGNHFAICNTQK